MARINSVPEDKLISYEGITTSNGAADGTNILDSSLPTEAEYNGNLIILTSGTYKGESRDIEGTTLAGTITLHAAFSDQIVSGTSYIIYGIRTVPAEVSDINDLIKIRTIASGSKTITNTSSKYLQIDSGTNHAEILSIIIKGVLSDEWTLKIYIPTDDAVASPAAGDKRDEIVWTASTAEAGILSGTIGIAYNIFLSFTNNNVGSGSEDIDDVVVVYRSASALTLTWET